MRYEGFRNPPVQVGEEVDVKIEAVGEKGDGIAKKDGFVLFVPGVKEGDEVRIKITKVLRRVGFAEVVGSAQGKVEESSKPEEEAAPVEEENQEAAAEEPSPEGVNDTEDFGEDSEEKEE